MKLSDLQKDSLHHAYLLSGGAADFDSLAVGVEGLLGITLLGNPDALASRQDAFKVEHARAVVTHVGRSAMVSGATKVVLIYFTTITREAQNILLKSLEEPSKDTHIFILTPNVEMLLPTVLSRCMQAELDGENLGVRPLNESTEAFIKASVPERLKIIDKIVKGKDKAANKTQMLELLSSIEAHLAKSRPKDLVSGLGDSWTTSVRVVLQAKEYMHSKGAMSKMLMESVALVV